MHVCKPRYDLPPPAAVAHACTKLGGGHEEILCHGDPDAPSNMRLSWA